MSAVILFTALLFPSFCVAGQNTTPIFDSGSAFNYLTAQCDYGPRNPGSAGHRNCRDYLVHTLRGFADEVTVQPFTLYFGNPRQTAECFNIIARFKPDVTERILLCAHWDTRPWGDKDPDPAKRSQPIMGANDGASGVAVLLEIARILKKSPPDIGVDIVLFDGEDAGAAGSAQGWIQGSIYFARNLPLKPRPRYGILLDMIGDADLNIYREESSQQYARPIVDKVWDKAAQLGLDAFKNELKYSVIDDHLPLLEIGISCIDIIDFDYPFWHTAGDTQDKCSAASLDQVGRLMIALIYEKKE